MAYTITITDEIAQSIEEYDAAVTAAGDAEENGDSSRWAAADDAAHDLLRTIANQPRADETPGHPLLVDGDHDQNSIRLTVTEETVNTVYLHPDRAPEGYDLTEDRDDLVTAAVADAISYNLGDTSIVERFIDGLDKDQV